MRMLTATAIAVSLALFTGTVASAADAEKSAPKAAQQTPRDKCAAEAKTQNLTPTKTRAFMSGCLAKTPSANKPATAQQDKRKDCTKQAGDQNLKGGARKAFVRACVKG